MAEVTEKQYSLLMTDILAEKTFDEDKTQTRRVIMPQPDIEFKNVEFRKFVENSFTGNATALFSERVGKSIENLVVRKFRCGEVGSRIFIKENYFAFGKWRADGMTATGKQKFRFVDMTGKVNAAGTKNYMYAASGEKPMYLGGRRELENSSLMWWKRPSLYMPRRAARSIVEITELRVERVQDISEADARAEGMVTRRPRLRFQYLWDDINKARGFGWDANPWVIVINYIRLNP